jgi:hypothetical protein
MAAKTIVGNEDEIRFWLKSVLTEENLDDFSVNILGNSEKGEQITVHSSLYKSKWQRKQ